MIRVYYLFFLLIIASGCNKSGESEKQECDEGENTCLFNVSSIIPDATGGVPNEALTFDTNISLVNFSRTREDKILEAAELLQKVVASEEFKDAVFNFTFEGKRQFVDSGGLSNAQVYQRLLEGAEKLSPARNNAMDIIVELYYEDTNTIGYTKPETKKIWINTKYFDRFTPAQVAGNLMHEWLHKLGFGHDSVYNEARSSSVPYAIGYIITRFARNY